MGALLPPDINRRIGRAMHTYDMLADGDRVLVAVSGGIDSLVLLWLLDFWRRKAPICYDLRAVHIDMEPDGEDPGPSARSVRREVTNLQIPLEIIPAQWLPGTTLHNDSISRKKDLCFTCARHRRRQLFDHARRIRYNKIAMGHHRDDIIETFFLNICFAGNISTMLPRQDLFAGSLSLIRPLSFLDKSEISMIAEQLAITPVRSTCPLGEQTRRLDVRQWLDELYHRLPEAKMRIFAALANVRPEYMLKTDGKNTDTAGQ